ncbi:hypothetical protein LBW59_15710 [Ralstonia solanacearum]|uniref:ATP-binding protein n=1 Tax=Ralstonia solanacearum TaxID=305 RepID=A0AAW5ZRT1_RALSL|nr:hypothetical protein [Ralstonia solanacearum]MDB0572207.1 hypothetical protein [Ralstonia solanacearum]
MVFLEQRRRRRERALHRFRRRWNKRLALAARQRFRPLLDEGEFFRWHAPAIFSIGGGRPRQLLLGALAQLRDVVIRRRRKVVLDFARTQKMYSEGTLLFLAEVRRLIRYSDGAANLSALVPANRKVAQVLEQIGFFRLLGVACPVQPEDDDVIYWRHAHGQSVDGAKYEDVLSEYDGQIAESLQKMLYKGVSEAMTNVVNHAYLAPRKDGLAWETERDWWLFSQEKDGVLSIVFCDLGAGIPGTLPARKPELWRRIVMQGRHRDGSAIKYAVHDSVTRTRQSHRGKGLGQIVSVIKDLPGAQVAIYSNAGAILRRPTGGTKVTEYADSILGTLINWMIPLPSKESL